MCPAYHRTTTYKMLSCNSPPSSNSKHPTCISNQSTTNKKICSLSEVTYTYMQHVFFWFAHFTSAPPSTD